DAGGDDSLAPGLTAPGSSTLPTPEPSQPGTTDSSDTTAAPSSVSPPPGTGSQPPAVPSTAVSEEPVAPATPSESAEPEPQTPSPSQPDASSPDPTQPAPTFLLGADISSIPEAVDNGASFIDTDGANKSMLALLQNHGFNAVRLRTFVDPKAEYGY